VNEGEYKLMGAAPYGTPRYVETIFERILTLHSDGSYSLNRDFFKYEYADSMICHKQFQKLFGIPARKAEEPMEPVHFDIAASVQKVFEEALLAVCRHAKEITKKSNVCLAGGSALNCAANSRLLLEGIFSDAWVFPAA
jgi:carbamoyltransferase